MPNDPAYSSASGIAVSNRAGRPRPGPRGRPGAERPAADPGQQHAHLYRVDGLDLGQQLDRGHSRFTSSPVGEAGTMTRSTAAITADRMMPHRPGPVSMTTWS